MFSRFSASLVALFSLAAVVVAIPADLREVHGISPRATGRMCGNTPSLEVVSQKEDDFASMLAQSDDCPSDGPYTVQVVFNVIYASEDINDGYIP